MLENLQQNLLESEPQYKARASYRGDFHANPTAVLENVWRLMMNAICGASSLECFVTLELDGSWQKTWGGLLSSEHGQFFGNVLRDLAKSGCNAWWYCFPAYAVGAKYIGERVCIVATPNCKRWVCMDNKQKIRPDEKHLERVGQWEARQNDLLPYPERLECTRERGAKRNDDGLSSGMDALKAYGNAVNPYQFYPVFAAIAEIERAAQPQFEKYDPKLG